MDSAHGYRLVAKSKKRKNQNQNLLRQERGGGRWRLDNSIAKVGSDSLLRTGLYVAAAENRIPLPSAVVLIVGITVAATTHLTAA